MKAQFKELGGWFANNAYSAVDTTGTSRKVKRKLKKVKDLTSVNKMSPDQADLHVMGSGASKTKTRGKLKKYPEATRRIS